MSRKIAGAEAPIEIVWDSIGVPHVFAQSIADAYRGMGYAAGSERLWQIHLSTAYANCEAAALLGERFVAQDAIQRACNVHGRHTGLVDSPGDWIADAYLEGLNATIDELTELPPEFVHAEAEPRHFTRADIAARYRFTSWFQHKSWTEKMALGRLMATHGVEWFRRHVLHFSDSDADCIETLSTPLQQLSIAPFVLAYPEAAHVISGSNNWAITGELSASGKPMLATDPHQPHSIPNTFFYVHLHAPGWDVFGAAFPGVPYFMMGTTRNVAWGLTTGMIDCYDVYLEQLNDRDEYRSGDSWRAIDRYVEGIDVKGGSTRDVTVARTHHGPLLEHLSGELGLNASAPEGYATSLHWSLADVPTSAGALALLPLAENAEDFGYKLYEDDVCPLVNNIICVDKASGLRRFIAATLPHRQGVTGSVPLPGWDNAYDFPLSTAEELTVEIDPPSGYALTANDDTMGEQGPFYIHNFPATPDRADRIRQHLEAGAKFSVDDFKAMQLDLRDLRAERLLPDLLTVLQTSDDALVESAVELLSSWDRVASADAAAPCLFYPFLDRLWARKFMRRVFPDCPVINAVPTATPALSMFDIEHFLAEGSPWRDHEEVLRKTIVDVMTDVVRAVSDSLGPDQSTWQWGQLHQIFFSHRLHKNEPWREMVAGPDPIGGSGTTLAMAMHMGPGPGREKEDEIPCRVYHGPAFRWIFDFGDSDHIEFVIAGGNGGQAGSPFATNLYSDWLNGEYHTLSYLRDELDVYEEWAITPGGI